MGRSWSSLLPASVLAALSPPSYLQQQGPSRPNSATTATPAAPPAAEAAAPAMITGDKQHGGAGSPKEAAAAVPGAEASRRLLLPTVVSGQDLAGMATAPRPPSRPVSRLSNATGGILGDMKHEAGAASVVEVAAATPDGSSSGRYSNWVWWPRKGQTSDHLAHTASAASEPAHVGAEGQPAAAAVDSNTSSSRGWWPSWGSFGSAGVEGPAASDRQAAGWWAGWLSAAKPAAQLVPAVAAAPSPAVDEGEEAAADMAGTAGSSTTVQAWRLASSIAELAIAPALWYWQGVCYVVSGGVDMTSRLVELAIWWALLPARMALWALVLPVRLEVSLARWLLPRRSGTRSADGADQGQQGVSEGVSEGGSE